MRVPIYQVDAFAERPFAGNPAAVVLLEGWPADEVLRAIAAENNLSETAFLVREAPRWRLRWFTPMIEVEICGHATLAAAHVLGEVLGERVQPIEFETRSGVLAVTRDGNRLALDFPARPPAAVDAPPGLAAALGRAPAEVLAGRDYLCVFARREDVATLAPDMTAVARLDRTAVIVTAPGEDCDFVSRFFAPAKGVPEDPVTGSAHCTLIPYWARRLGKTTLVARQLSHRGGTLWCEDRGARVTMAGHAVLVIEGTLAF